MTPQHWQNVKESKLIDRLIDKFQQRTSKSRETCEQYARDYLEAKRAKHCKP